MTLEPLLVTPRILAINLQPPTLYVPERKVVRLSCAIVMFNDDTTVGYEVFPDAKRDVLDVFARWIKLSIQGIDINPWEEVGVHQSPIGRSEDMSLAFRLGNDGSMNVVEVEC